MIDHDGAVRLASHDRVIHRTPGVRGALVGPSEVH